MKDRITIALDKNVIDFIVELAENDSRSVSSTINQILREYAKKNKDKATTTIIKKFL